MKQIAYKQSIKRRQKPAKDNGHYGKSLNPREWLFVERLSSLENLHNPITIKQAALDAGYKKDNASVQASLLLAKPKIKDALMKRRSETMAKINLTPDRTIQEIACLAHSNIVDFFEDDGRLKNVKQLPRHITAAIKEVEVSMSLDGMGKPAVIQKIKLYDKTKPLEMLGSYFKIFSDGAVTEFMKALTATMDQMAVQRRQALLESVEQNSDLVEEQV